MLRADTLESRSRADAAMAIGLCLTLVAATSARAAVHVTSLTGNSTGGGQATVTVGGLNCGRFDQQGPPLWEASESCLQNFGRQCRVYDAYGYVQVSAYPDTMPSTDISSFGLQAQALGRPNAEGCDDVASSTTSGSASFSATFAVDTPTRVTIHVMPLFKGVVPGTVAVSGLPGVTSLTPILQQGFDTSAIAEPPGFSISGSVAASASYPSGEQSQNVEFSFDFSPLPPRRPVVVVPGIGGTYAADLADDGPWLFQRGIDPSFTQTDPLAGAYDDLLQTLRNVGYVDGKDLFVVDYDWRLPPGPADGIYDGFVSGLTGASVADSSFEYGVDYLGAVLRQAVQQWAQDHGGEALDVVDVIAHSTGGLVARTYIQSAAYGDAVDSSTTLPRVRNLILVGVPNRGASKAWNPLHDNWVADPAYVAVLSKILNRVYLKLPGGAIVGGPQPIDALSIADPLSGQPDPIQFIDQYVPTIRALLATYDFLDLGNGVDNVNADPAARNDWLLDLNAGFDFQPAGDPASFASLCDTTTVIYGTNVATPTTVERLVGPAVGGRRIAAFGDFVPRAPAPGEEWFLDHAVAANGDGTVPIESSAELFYGDSRVLLAPFAKGANTSAGVSHLALMFNPDVQELILSVLGASFEPSDVSTSLHQSTAQSLWSGANIIRTGALVAALDPVDGFVVDGLGRRLGYSDVTGPVTEIPDSRWIGRGDGFGFAFGPVVGPLDLQVTGTGAAHFAGAGALAMNGVGSVVDSGTLAAGESRITRVATQAIKPGCDNGVDDDGDGLVDMDDPGCPAPEAALENPQCDNGADDDGDGLVDFADPDCSREWPYWESPPRCGVGAELALVMGALLRRWNRVRPRRSSRP